MKKRKSTYTISFAIYLLTDVDSGLRNRRCRCRGYTGSSLRMSLPGMMKE